MKKIFIYTIIFMCAHFSLYAQDDGDNGEPDGESQSEDIDITKIPEFLWMHDCATEHEEIDDEFYEIPPRKWEGCLDKTIRLSFHFFLSDSDEGNFTESGDNYDNMHNGYSISEGLINFLNERVNVKLNIPPNHNIPVEPYNFDFVLDAIFFHRDESVRTGGINSTLHSSTYGYETDNSINVYFTSASGPSYASSISPTSNIKYTELKGVWEGYINVRDNDFPLSWFYHGNGITLFHELGHLLSLSHTVRWNNGPACPTVFTTGNVNTSCDDGCDDTPSAWYITDVLNSGRHPACGWGNGSEDFCTNNLMDYAGSQALSPCQLNRIHSALENGMIGYLACNGIALNNNLQILDFDPNQIGYYGNNVDVGQVNNSLTTIEDKEQAVVYFNNEVILENFEVKDNTAFEIIHSCICD